MEQRARLLVVGAAMGSLGRAVYEAARPYFDATTAGINQGAETHYLDVTEPDDIASVLNRFRPEHIVCTAGINETDGTVPMENADYAWWLERSFRVNSSGPMVLLHHWSTYAGAEDWLPGPKHFVAISSNSAHIARSGSAAYCMSKAALSMGLRCAAREMAGGDLVVYGYEPGWLDGTPMSARVARRFGDATAQHRIPGGQGVDVARLAGLIVRNLRYGGPELNGTGIRVDGGEQ